MKFWGRQAVSARRVLARRRPCEAQAGAFARLSLVILAIAANAAVASAQLQGGHGLYNRPPDSAPPQASATPEGLKNVGIEQRLNEQLPLDVVLHDENHKAVRLGDYFKDKKPVVLAFVYYECPMLCNQVLNGLLNSVKEVPFNIGEDYRVVVVSFDEREDKDPDLPQKKKRTYLHYYLQDGKRPEDKAQAGWAFLTGEKSQIEKLTDAAGFHFQYDPVSEQYAHASGIMVATPDGKLARYFYGIQYPPKDLRLGLVEASQEKIASPVDQLLLYCYHYDPTTGKYGARVMNIIKLGGVVTVVSIVALIVGLSVGFKNKRAEEVGF